MSTFRQRRRGNSFSARCKSWSDSEENTQRNSDAKHRNHAKKNIGDEAPKNIQDRYSSNVGKILHMIVVNAELKKRTMMNG